MSKVLYITANPKVVSQSFGLQVGEEFLNEYKKHNPSDEIVHLDVYNMEIPFIDYDMFDAWGKLAQGIAFNELSEVQQKNLTRFNELTEQFIEADKYVFVTPLWNFSIPPMLKAYFDNVLVAGKTFKYTENGPVGLLKGKKALHIQARGGIYSEGPALEVELGDRYVKTALGFIGVVDVETLAVEGMNFTPDKAEDIRITAIEKAKKVAERF